MLPEATDPFATLEPPDFPRAPLRSEVGAAVKTKQGLVKPCEGNEVPREVPGDEDEYIGNPIGGGAGKFDFSGRRWGAEEARFKKLLELPEIS
mmetsp:Transcript_66412/g.138701  ORF Transcript_66412/g.138701 Transcript_66412/m.138701 type:complete len:93 (-) Transcript_66412:658-936(-)